MTTDIKVIEGWLSIQERMLPGERFAPAEALSTAVQIIRLAVEGLKDIEDAHDNPDNDTWAREALTNIARIIQGHEVGGK